MIALQGYKANFPHSVFDYQASQDGRFAWFLLTWHPEINPVLEEIQTQVKMDIRNSEISNVSRLNVEIWLKNYFSEYHWKLHAALRKTDLKEKGLSLIFAVLYDHELFVVEFGRMLCGLVSNEGIRPLGRYWTNFHVKTQDEMQFLGMKEADISIKPLRLYIPEQTKFIALPSHLTDKLNHKDIDISSINTILDAYLSELGGCYFLLEGKIKIIVNKKRKLKPFQISSMLIFLLTFVAILYMFLGNRWFETVTRKLKILLSNKSTLTMEQIPQFLKIDTENLKKQLQKIEEFTTQPARKIKLTEIWRTDLRFLITAAPCFDHKDVFIASENKLMAFDKDTKKLHWTRSFDSNISEMIYVRGRLLVFLENQSLIGIREGNTISFKKNYIDKLKAKRTIFPLEIDSEMDPRISGSILIVPMEKGLYIYDVLQGNLITGVSFPNRIQFISPYDALSNCFYVVVADAVHCIELQIQS